MTIGKRSENRKREKFKEGGDCGKEDEVWDHEGKATEGFQKK